jgi:hypothetical protein
MSIEGMNGAWEELNAGAQEFYSQTSEHLIAGQTLEYGRLSDFRPLLDQMLDASEQLQQQADAALRETTAAEDAQTAARDYEQIAELTLAAAAVDALLARDILALDPDVEYDRNEEPAAEELTSTDIYAEGQELLNRVDELFNEQLQSLAGRSPYDPPHPQILIGEVEQVTRRLIDLAEPPTRELLRGLAKVATGPISGVLSAVQHLGVISTLDLRAQVLAKHAPRFVRAHVVKIVTLRSDGGVVDEMADQLTDWFVENMDVEALLERVADSPKAVAVASARIDAVSPIEQEHAEALLADLTTLNNDYGKHMDWIGDSAKWLRRGASPLSHLGAAIVGPLSYAIAAGIFFVGIGYVGYSLTDRLDARELGFADRVEGVVRLVERHLPPQ